MVGEIESSRLYKIVSTLQVSLYLARRIFIAFSLIAVQLPSQPAFDKHTILSHAVAYGRWLWQLIPSYDLVGVVNSLFAYAEMIM